MCKLKKIDRDTNCEWLRIISMLLIVMGHAVTHGGFEKIPLTANGMVAIAMTQGARIGVDIFLLLTGYFSVGKDLSFHKLKSQYLQIWLYSVMITGVMIVIGVIPFGIKTIASAIFPIATSQYWFATCYFLLRLITPALEIFIKNVSEKTYRQILAVLFIAWSVLPQLHLGEPGYSNFGWFVFVYLLAAYMKLYPKEWMEKIQIWHGICLFLIICLAAVTIGWEDFIPSLKKTPFTYMVR